MRLSQLSRDVRRHGRSRHAASWISSVTLAFSILSSSVSAQLNSRTSPTHQFKSRPDLHAPVLDFAILKPASVAPGYIFLGPYRNLDPGPYIYDNAGQLVWSGAGSSGPRNAHAPQVCQYRGRDHLCFFEGQQHGSFARGHGVIMDQNYRIVQTIESAGAGASSDMHEFREAPFANGTTLLTTVYQPRQFDMSVNPRFNIRNGMGWVAEGVFQEVEIDTGRVLFEWRSLDHVDPSDSWVMPGTTDSSGTGLSEQNPWNYFHLNSVDKDPNGDYLISARHTSAIYKVSGVDGHILWQLGGNQPTIEGSNARFSFQHDAKFVSENQTHTVISVFDNGSNMWNQTSEFSHGKIIEIDHARQSATTIKQWGLPEPAGGLQSSSQGNLQILPGGGCHMGWGEYAYFSEHTADGETVMYAKLAQRESNVMIYRSHKFPWVGVPLTKPALWTYSLDGAGRMGFWVSWNGATEVQSWNFYIGESANGPFEFAGSVEKSGFESEQFLDVFAPWAYAEALDGSQRVLERSVIARTFVPSSGLRQFCDEQGCDAAQRVPREDETPYDAQILLDPAYLSPNRGFNTSRYYEATPNDRVLSYPSSSSASDIAPSRMIFGEDGVPGSSVFRFGVGLLLGFAGAVLGSFLVHTGRLRRLQPFAQRLSGRTLAFTEGVTKSAFGSKFSGRYTRIHEKEMDSGSSSRSSIVY